MKRLIVNADDLGLAPGVNRAIFEARRNGIVTSATLMANGAAFDDALRRVADGPPLDIGCHIDLVQMPPVARAAEIRALAPDGHFRSGLAALAIRTSLGKIAADQIAAEAVAQMRKLQAAGIRVSHFDTHRHTHVFPAVLRPLLRAARECGVRAVRNPFEPRSVVSFQSVRQSWPKLVRWAAVQPLRGLSGMFRRHVRAAGLATPDGTVGIALTGFWDQQTLSDMLRRLPEGTWELVAHPGYAEPGLADLTKLTQSRETELQCLTAAETRTVLENSGIELITFDQLSA